VHVGEAVLRIRGDNGKGQLHNLAGGLYDFQGDDGTVMLRVGLGSGSTFNNLGTVRKSSGSGAALIRTESFNNSGTTEVAVGTLQVDSAVAQIAGSALTGGTWKILDGATLDLVSAPNLASNSANVVLEGPGSTFAKLGSLANNAGSLSLLGGRDFTTAGALTNTGSVTVGPGSTLSVTGAYTQGAAGTFTTHIGGNPASGQIGQFTSNGTATLDGTFSVSLVNGFGPTAGQSFPIMNFPDHIGTFSTLTGLTLGRFPLFDVNLSPTSLILNGLTTTAGLAFDRFDVATFPTSGMPGQNVTITYTVRNQSSTPATGDWFDSVYLSRDGTLDPDDALLQRVHHVGDVAGLSSYTETLTAALPALADGGYRVIVLADSRGLVLRFRISVLVLELD
jgi:hypothetical protein